MEKIEKSEICKKLKKLFNEYTKDGNFKPEEFFDAFFEVTEEHIAEYAKRDLDEYEVIADLSNSLDHHDMFRMYIKEAILFTESKMNSELVENRIGELIASKISKFQ